MELTIYSQAWTIYMVCAAGILLSLLSFLLVFSKRWVFFIIAVSAVILLWPYKIANTYNWQAPAAMVVALDFFLQQGDVWPDALRSLLSAVAVCVLVCVVFIFILLLNSIGKKEDEGEASTLDNFVDDEGELSSYDDGIEEGFSARKTVDDDIYDEIIEPIQVNSN